ncbi:MAG: hypothetical protein EOP14_03175 [Pseudomonas sp.]|nr:MAG: hypothetical protein EOP14_03175 [Pseudomonas sp.]
MTPKQAAKARRRTLKEEKARAPQAPFTAGSASAAPAEGPTTLRTTHEGLSIGKFANSTAAGAAGQLTPKDEL